MTPEPLSSAGDGDRPAIDAALVDAMALAVYGGFLALACRTLRIDVVAVRALDPRKGATADAEWFTAAKARHVAIYLANQAVGIPQRTLSRLLDLTPPAIHFAIRSVEDLRDDTTFDRLVSAIEVEMTGRAT